VASFVRVQVCSGLVSSGDRHRGKTYARQLVRVYWPKWLEFARVCSVARRGGGGRVSRD